MDILNKELKTKKSRERMKVIVKYIDIFNVIFVARYIDYSLIAPLINVDQKTVERAFKEIRKDEYGKDLIIETKKGNKITVYASDILFRLLGSANKCPVKKNDSKPVYISSSRKNAALIRVLKDKFKDSDINSHIKAALIANDMTEIEETVIKHELKQNKAFLVNSYSYQNYLVYKYVFDLLKFNEDLDLGSLVFDKELQEIRADLFCFSNDVNDIIRTYDKALLILEVLRDINYEGSKQYSIKINYAVITLDRVDISEYVNLFRRTYRYHTINLMMRWYWDLSLNKVRNSKYFFKMYKDATPQGTQFFIFSTAIGEFIEYGKKIKKIIL